MMPQRVQLSRRRGYRKPEGAVVVARPSRWGNPVAIVCTRAVHSTSSEMVSVSGARSISRATRTCCLRFANA